MDSHTAPDFCQIKLFPVLFEKNSNIYLHGVYTALYQAAMFRINDYQNSKTKKYRSSHPEVFLRKGVLKISGKLREENPCRSVISTKLLCNFIEIALRHGFSSVNLLHIFRTLFPRNTSTWLVLKILFLLQ